MYFETNLIYTYYSSTREQIMKLFFALAIGLTLSGAARAQDRCGCRPEFDADRASCGNNYVCRDQATARYYACLRNCYPQNGNSGTVR